MTGFAESAGLPTGAIVTTGLSFSKPLACSFLARLVMSNLSVRCVAAAGCVFFVAAHARRHPCRDGLR